MLQTDGNIWRLMMLCFDKFEYTPVFVPQNEFEKIYLDLPLCEVILGLIKFSLNQKAENELKLKDIYDFIDERRYAEYDPDREQ